MHPLGLRKRTVVLLIILVILCAGLAIHYPMVITVLAQDEPTDRPFPTAAAKTTIPPAATSASSAADTAGSAEVTPTVRPFPSAVPKTATPESATSSVSAATAAAAIGAVTAVAARQMPTLSSDSAMATITAMQAETKDLQDKLASAQGDKGATLYALVVVLVGLALSFGVFFGLRHCGK